MANSTTYRVILSSRAEQEIEASWKWYEERQQRLGDRFVEEVVLCLKRIENYPERYPFRYKFYKETMIEVFPFSIIYRINKKKKLVQVVSVFHTSRNPKKRYPK